MVKGSDKPGARGAHKRAIFRCPRRDWPRPVAGPLFGPAERPDVPGVVWDVITPGVNVSLPDVWRRRVGAACDGRRGERRAAKRSERVGAGGRNERASVAACFSVLVLAVVLGWDGQRGTSVAERGDRRARAGV